MPALVTLVVNRVGERICDGPLEAQVVGDNIGALCILISSVDCGQVSEVHQPSIRSIQSLAKACFERLPVRWTSDIAIDVLADIRNRIEVRIHIEWSIVPEVETQ